MYLVDTYKYTIVSAVYNVEKYLNDFFKSIVNQTLSFEKNIILILIDDGSTDNSANIIKKWQKKYKNIEYIYQDNQGQASARNNGLQYVKTTWVTFIDSDDFIDKKYFKIVDNTIKKHNEISFIACKLIYYFEHLRLKINYHPLRSSFKKNEDTLISSDLKDKIQLSASATFFKTNLIKKINLQFDTNVKPNFEDGHFIGKYLLEYQDIEVAFLYKCKYFYRKRKENTSTVDTSWDNPLKYNDLLTYGYLDLLQSYNHKKGYIPNHIQRMVLYDLMWHFKKHINSSKINNILTIAQQKQYEVLLLKIFFYIEIKTILNFNLAGCTFMYKVALIHRYKSCTPYYQVIFIDSIKSNKVYLHYFSSKDILFQYKIDKTNTKYKIQNTEKINFLNKQFIIKYNIELYVPKKYKILNITLDTCPVYIGDQLDIINKKNMKKDYFIVFKKFSKNIIRKLIIGTL